MNRTSIILAVLGVALIGGYLTVTVGSGNLVTESREVAGFDSIELQGQGQLMVTQRQGSTEKLLVEAEDNIIPLLDTYVRGDTLKLQVEKGLLRTVIPRKGIRYYVTVDDLKRVDISGSGSLDAEVLKTEKLKVSVNGSGRVELKYLEAEEFTAEINGSGKFRLSGVVDRQRVDISGSGKYLATELQSDFASVDISGSGKTELSVARQLDVEISGSGKVSYYGRPRVSQKISGSGEVVNLED